MFSKTHALHENASKFYRKSFETGIELRKTDFTLHFTGFRLVHVSHFSLFFIYSQAG